MGYLKSLQEYVLITSFLLIYLLAYTIDICIRLSKDLGKEMISCSLIFLFLFSALVCVCICLLIGVYPFLNKATFIKIGKCSIFILACLGSALAALLSFLVALPVGLCYDLPLYVKDKIMKPSSP